jgi:hypothetical protein
MTPEEKIIATLRVHPDAAIRDVGEKLSAMRVRWTAQQLRSVLRTMLAEASS